MYQRMIFDSRRKDTSADHPQLEVREATEEPGEISGLRMSFFMQTPVDVFCEVRPPDERHDPPSLFVDIFEPDSV